VACCVASIYRAAAATTKEACISYVNGNGKQLFKNLSHSESKLTILKN